MNPAETYPSQVFWDERDNGFIAIAPDLSGCSAFGETRAEALSELDAAVSAWIETAKAAGEPVPDPSPVPVPATHSGKLLLRIPVSLHQRLAREAKAEGVSLNQWMTALLSAAPFQPSHRESAAPLYQGFGEAPSPTPDRG
jgi:predicted RNase H-like HicB family nuclease